MRRCCSHLTRYATHPGSLWQALACFKPQSFKSLIPHGLRQFPHGFPRFRHQFVSQFAFMLIDVQQLLSEDLIGERGLDLVDTVFGQVRLIRIHRPRHHVDVGMVALVMEGGVPAKVPRWNLHRRGDVVAVGTQ